MSNLKPMRSSLILTVAFLAFPNSSEAMLRFPGLANRALGALSPPSSNASNLPLGPTAMRRLEDFYYTSGWNVTTLGQFGTEHDYSEIQSLALGKNKLAVVAI